MKKSLGYLLLLLALAGCKRFPQASSYKKQIKEAYVFTFKVTYFKRLLTKAYNDSEAMKQAIAIDKSGYGEPLLSIEDLSLIDSFSKIDNQSIIMDSLNRVDKVGEGAQGKQIFSFALFKYQSKWLDSLANQRYKIFWKNNRNTYE
jgi:hypothetical protein